MDIKAVDQFGGKRIHQRMSPSYSYTGASEACITSWARAVLGCWLSKDSSFSADEGETRKSEYEFEAAAGMIVRKLLAFDASVETTWKPTMGITMFGVTTLCITAVKERLMNEGYEAVVFHSTGVGSKAMEELVRAGF